MLRGVGTITRLRTALSGTLAAGVLGLLLAGAAVVAGPWDQAVAAFVKVGRKRGVV